jgi:hypothetical protein
MSQTPDPLYVIFEQHLFHFQDPDMDRKKFIQAVIADYFNFLRKHHVTVPKSLEQPIAEELASQVQSMLVKKIYGCPNLQEFQVRAAKTEKRRARARYQKLTAG